MAKIVVDTNVWAKAGTPASKAETFTEIDCIENCADWLRKFLDSDYKLLIDLSEKVLDEYDPYIRPGGSTEPIINELYSRLWGRLEYVDIEFDAAGHAILPAGLSFHDPDDRKFIALAVKCEPHAPIYNAADTDWAKEKARLAAHGIQVRELCPAYIGEKLREN